jgi:thiol:disulfide interchange protein DsbD
MRYELLARNSRAAAGLFPGVNLKLWCIAAALAVPWVTPVAAEEPQPVRARLVADASAPAPGGTLQVGVLLEIDEGWHVYWKNPGDAGLATEVRLTLPEGLAASALSWPAPHRFTQPGGLVGYGYERTLLLASAVRLAGPPPADGASLAADTSWLACKEVCLIGSARLEGRWPLDVAAPEFESWRSELPAADPPFSVNVTGGWAPGERRADVSVWLSWPAPPGEVELFPEAGGRLKVASPRVQTRGSLTRVDLEVTKVGSGGAPADDLAAVVAARDASGRRRAWEIVIPLADQS